MGVNQWSRLLHPIQYYRNLSLPARAGVWFLICNFLQKGIAALTTPVFTRLLNTAEYGRVSVYYSWQDMASIFITFGLSSSVYSRGLVKYEGRQEDYTGIMLTLATITTAAAGVLGLLLQKHISRLLGFSAAEILFIIIYTYVSTGLDFWYQSKRVSCLYVPFVAVTLAMTIARPCAAVVFPYLSPDNKAAARIVSDLLVMAAGGIPVIVSMLRKSRKYADRTVWTESMRYVLPLVPHFLSQRILSQSDRIMIHHMIGAGPAGIYSLAYSVGMLLMLLNNAFDGVIGPWTFKRMKEREYGVIREVNQRMMVFFAMCSACFMLIAPELVRLFAAPAYYEAVCIVPVIAAGSFFIYLYTQFIYFEYYIGKTQMISLATLISSGLNFMLNYILIQMFGYSAAAYTTLACYILYAAGHYWIMKYVCKRYLHITEVYHAPFITAVSVCVAFMGVAAPYMYAFTAARRLAAGMVMGMTVAYGFHIISRFGMRGCVRQ